MAFHAHLDGYFGTFATLNDLRTWANGLVRKNPSLTGKVLQIHKALRTVTCGSTSAAVYSGKPGWYREIVIGA